MTERELQALAEWVALPDERDLAPAVRARLHGRPARRGWLVVALVAAVVAAAAALATPPARSAILRFFHLQGVTIEYVDHLPAVAPPTELVLGQRIDPAAAAEQAGFQPLSSPLLGAPDAVSWDGELLWYRYGNVRLLVAQFLGRTRPDLIKKVFDRRTRITPVTVDGRQGYFISGAEHVFLVAPNDLIQESRVRLARDVLVWEHGNLTLRIEGDLTLRKALKIAKSFR